MELHGETFEVLIDLKFLLMTKITDLYEDSLENIVCAASKRFEIFDT